jgi:hypothetical protein
MGKFVQKLAVLVIAVVCLGNVARVYAERRDSDRGHDNHGRHDRHHDHRGHENREPDLSDLPKLEVPAGNKVSFHAYAVGVQIYTWDGAAWVFQAPEAFLYSTDHCHGVVGIHYAGPTWESNSGSYVVGAVIERATVDPTAIPWLKLGAVDSDGPGIFDGTTFIQRVNTVGGIAPAQPGHAIGQEARVPYTAEYYFYRKAH